MSGRERKSVSVRDRGSVCLCGIGGRKERDNVGVRERDSVWE